MSYKDKERNKTYMKAYRLAHKQAFAERDNQYYLKHKDSILQQRKEYYSNHKSESLERQRKYYKSHRAERDAYDKQWRAKNHDKLIINAREYRQGHKIAKVGYETKYKLKIKTQVLSHYGNGKATCVKCGYTDIRALSIDHINGGGAKHKEENDISGGSNFYLWLIRNHLPYGYQTLCMNCQFIKRYENNEMRRMTA